MEIEFEGKKYKYIELRILTLVECEKVSEKITTIINFLKSKNYIINLTMFFTERIRAENVSEYQNKPSLTIDMRDDFLRFKFWTGASTIWTYHTKDLLESIDAGTEEFLYLYKKYEKITKKIENFVLRFNTSIQKYSYEYNITNENKKYDIKYTLTLSPNLENGDGVKVLFELLDKELLLYSTDDEYSFFIDYKFPPHQEKCTPCEEARKKREEEKRKREEEKRKKEEETNKESTDNEKETILKKIKNKLIK